MKGKEDRFGINVMAYCREHEKYLDEMLAQGVPVQELLLWHEKKLEWLQHERLIHLLVTVFTGIVFIFAVILWIFLEGNAVPLVLAGILLVLLTAYLIHYFRLENTVQHWYMLAERLHDKFLQPTPSEESSNKTERPSGKCT